MQPIDRTTFEVVSDLVRSWIGCVNGSEIKSHGYQ